VYFVPTVPLGIKCTEMDQRMFKAIAAVLVVLSFFIPRVRSQLEGEVPSPQTYPTVDEYLRSLRLELKWIAPSYIMAIAGTFFMTLAMIFLFLRGTQLRRSPGCGKRCSPGWSFCCLIPIAVIIGTFIAEMMLLSSSSDLYLIYLEIIITSALRNESLGLFFLLLMIYAIATMIGLVVFIVFAIQYAIGRKKRNVIKVLKLNKSFTKGSQRSHQMGSTTVVHDGVKEWAVIDIGHPEDESTLGTTTSSSPDSDDELQDEHDNGNSTQSTTEDAEQSKGPTNYDALY